MGIDQQGVVCDKQNAASPTESQQQREETQQATGLADLQCWCVTGASNQEKGIKREAAIADDSE